MKRMALFICASLLLSKSFAQSLQEAKRMIYCERFQSAQTSLHDILKKDSTNAEAWYLLAKTYLHNNQVKSAEDSLLLIPTALKNTAMINCAYGYLNLKKGRKDSAASYFKMALQQTKEKDPYILQAIATAHIDADSGDAVYAIDLLNKAIKKDRSDPSLYDERGDAFRKLQNGTEAYKAYAEAIDKNEQYAEALYKMGRIFVSQHNPDMYLKYFYKATSADSAYAPAWYALYFHYYFNDIPQAMNCLEHYIRYADKDEKNNYLFTDLLYLSKRYNAAIENAKHLISKSGAAADARLYKLVAYSYFGINDSVGALDYMRRYFQQGNDTAFILKDYETMGDIYARFPDKSDSAAVYFTKAVALEKDSNKKTEYFKKISGLYKKVKDYNNEAVWLGRYYESKQNPSNLDLFNWGLAHYLAGNYRSSDTIFSRYTEKYPDQTFGYYWRAKSAAAIDTNMEYGLAVPHYFRLIDIASKDTTENLSKKQLVEAYGYIAAYRANNLKDYPGAIDYFEKLLSLDPSNADAKKYVTILQKRLADKGTTKTGK